MKEMPGCKDTRLFAEGYMSIADFGLKVFRKKNPIFLPKMDSLREEMSIKKKLKTNCVVDSFGQRAYINILTGRGRARAWPATHL